MLPDHECCIIAAAAGAPRQLHDQPIALARERCAIRSPEPLDILVVADALMILPRLHTAP